MVENGIGNKLKCLRLDNGGEYCRNEFDNYYSYHGIRSKNIVLGTLEENGVPKRINMTIMECGRCMRLHVGFPL